MRKPSEHFSELEAQKATALELRRMLGMCPICKSSFEDHLYALFATDVISNKGTDTNLDDFFTALKSHQWPRVRASQAWDATGDNVEVYIIRCSSGRNALVTVRSPFEIFDPSTILDCEMLDEEGERALHELVADSSWHAL